MSHEATTLHASNRTRVFSRRSLVFAGLLCALVPVWANAQKHEQFAAGHIIVKPRQGVAAADFDNALTRHGAKNHGQIRATNIHLVDVPAGDEVVMAQQLALDPSVEYAEVDRRVPVQVTTASDPYYTNAWHLAKIGAPTAWDSAKGDGVVVAIIDSGVDGTHPDLAGKLVPGWNLYDNNSNTSDVYGHGTQVAGVVGAVSNNGLGVTSVAWNTKLMPVRVSMTDGSAYLSTIANGITWAADHGANIANCSFATLTGSATIQNAANYMRSKGGIVVVAAGNYGTLDSTANTSAMISVSATDSNDALTSWSSYGPYVDVAAPGAGIWTTTNGGGYAAVSGTSFSSPMTAAVLALEKSANPALTNVQLESILESTAVDLGTPGYDQYFGYGRINAAAAVAAALAQVTTNTTPVADTTAPTDSITSPSGGATVSGTVSVSVNASDNVGVTRVDLYAGTTLVGSASAAPYAFSLNSKNFANGSLNLVAYAYDQAGNKGTSATVTVNVSNLADTTAPTVAILNPVAGSTVSGTVSINLSASDNVAVAVLSLSIDGKQIKTSNSGALSYSWNTRKIARGTHTISAMARDVAGNITNKSITVTR